jgi:hypothetical protein
MVHSPKETDAHIISREVASVAKVQPFHLAECSSGWRRTARHIVEGQAQDATARRQSLQHYLLQRQQLRIRGRGMKPLAALRSRFQGSMF